MGFNQFKVATQDLEALERDVKSLKIPEYFEIRTTKDVGPRVSTLHVEVSPPLRFIDMRMSMQEQEEIRLKEKARAGEIDKEVIEKATEHRARMQDWGKREWVQLGPSKTEPKPDITLPSLRAHVTKTPDGLYHVQNIVMGHLGQHHIHTKGSFEEWRKTGVGEVKIEEGECGCDLKGAGWVREYDGKTWYNPKFAKSSLDLEIEEGRKKSEKKYGHLTLKQAALATKSEEDFINDVVRYNRRRISELDRWGPKDERGYPKQGWVETASQYWKHVREPKEPKIKFTPEEIRKIQQEQLGIPKKYAIVRVSGSGRIHALSEPMTLDDARKQGKETASFWQRGGFLTKIMPHKRAMAEFKRTHYKKGEQWIEKDAPPWSPDYKPPKPKPEVAKPPKPPKVRDLLKWVEREQAIPPRIRAGAWQVVFVDKQGKARGTSAPMSRSAAEASLGKLGGTEFAGSRLEPVRGFREGRGALGPKVGPRRKSLAARLLKGY